MISIVKIKIMIKIYQIVLLLALILVSCGKDDQQEEPEEPLEFISLQAGKSTIKVGETTSIKAVAKGSNLVYYWSATLGDILGSGPEVIYAASICQVGKNTVICKITNGKNQSESKAIEIVVVE
jgi:hypothetical protein